MANASATTIIPLDLLWQRFVFIALGLFSFFIFSFFTFSFYAVANYSLFTFHSSLSSPPPSTTLADVLQGEMHFDIHLEQLSVVGILVLHDHIVGIVVAVLLIEAAVPVPQVLEHLYIYMAIGIDAGGDFDAVEVIHNELRFFL